MKVLNLHCSTFSYNTVKPTPVAVGNANEGVFDNVMVCLTSFEKSDEGRVSEIVESFKKNLLVDFSRIKFSTVLLYPYAHLSKSLGSPRKAVEFLELLKESLNDCEFKVESSPFGWYKSWEMSCKGHPLAEAFREY
ncbi:MAG: hypothetical protein GON13_00470 [Nanoarchaeota archaeon]|nr:hypothetical protein [Nanoarchaeota archaeon]